MDLREQLKAFKQQEEAATRIEVNHAPPDPYQLHKKAVEEWLASCNNYRAAEARRCAAEKILYEATQALAMLMQQAQCDPTQPQPTQANQAPMNGLGALGSQRY